MAINREPILKRCRYLGISPAVMGISRRATVILTQTRERKFQNTVCKFKEKQKLKFIYGVLEKPFAHYFEIAEKNGRQGR